MVYTNLMLQGILSFNRPIGFPTTLPEFGGIDRAAGEKIRTAFKDPRFENNLRTCRFR